MSSCDALRTLLISLLTGAVSLIVSGCDSPSIDPFVTGSHFTVWGYISPFADTHFVRVIPVRRFPEEIVQPGDRHAEIDARVTSTDVARGHTRQWQHSLRRLDDGTYGHIFYSAFVVRSGGRYRLTVTRSDGMESVAETVVPSDHEVEILPAEVVDDRVIQIIRWKDVPTLENTDIIYCAAPIGIRACYDGEDGAGLIIGYGRKGARVGNDWEITVDLSRDFDFLRQINGLAPDLPLGLYTLHMRVIVLDAGWRVLLDPTEFAQPGALDNVETPIVNERPRRSAQPYPPTSGATQFVCHCQ